MKFSLGHIRVHVQHVSLKATNIVLLLLTLIVAKGAHEWALCPLKNLYSEDHLGSIDHTEATSYVV